MSAMLEVPCDLLIENAILLADAFAQPVLDSVLAVRDGAIIFAGARAAAPALRPGRRLDASGHLALPGLVNIHTHAALCVVRGVAEDLGFAPAYTPGIPQGALLTEGETVALARLGALEAMLAGSTLIVDTYVHAAATLPAMAALGLRVFASPRLHDVDLAAVAARRWVHDPAIGEAQLAALHDTVAVAARLPRAGAHLAAHASDTCSRDFLRRLRGVADSTGLRVATHLAQSRAEVERVRARDGLTPAELLEEAGLLDRRLIAAHCIHLSAADVARIGRAGVTVAHIPKGNATGGTIAPVRALAAAGCAIAIGTDNMHGDMIETLRWALAMGRIRQGGIDPAWQPEHVLHGATQAGADALGLGSALGALRVGRRADIVLVDLRAAHLTPHRDPLGTLTHTGVGRDVAWVFVDGEAVVAEGRPSRMDATAIRQDAQAAADSAWHRAGAVATRAAVA